MGNNQPTPDAQAFADRLHWMLDHVAEAPKRGRGRGDWLAAKCKVSPPSVNAWLNGRNKPMAERARQLANAFGYSFDWLYFGTGPERLNETLLPSANSETTGATSQSVQLDPQILAEAYLLAFQEFELETGKPYKLEHDPDRTVRAYAFLSTGRSASEVARFIGAAVRRSPSLNRGSNETTDRGRPKPK